MHLGIIFSYHYKFLKLYLKNKAHVKKKQTNTTILTIGSTDGPWLAQLDTKIVLLNCSYECMN